MKIIKAFTLFVKKFKGKIIQKLFGSKPGMLITINKKQYMLLNMSTWFPSSFKTIKVVQVTVHDPRDNRSHRQGIWAEIKPLQFIIVTDLDKIV